MKIRNGFVSNSSSSSFILDKRKLTNSTIASIRKLNPADGLGRSTAFAEGRDAVGFANEWNTECGEYGGGLGQWILDEAKRLGEENIIFVRESDEGMGGNLSDVGLSLARIRSKAEGEMEYH